MAPEKNEIQGSNERVDPDANPLTAFGRDSEFMDELIDEVCEKILPSREQSKNMDSETDTTKVRVRQKRSKNFRF